MLLPSNCFFSDTVDWHSLFKRFFFVSKLPVKTQSPQPGWLEVNPECTFNSVVDCIDATIANLEKLDIEPNDIVAIGLASQRCTAIAWDKATGDLIYPGCIMAGDLRATHMAEELKKVS